MSASGATDVADLAQQWLSLDQDTSTRAEIETLLKDDSTGDALRKCMTPRISFGTAGLRARMLAGFAYMNSLIVIQASQGLAEHFLKQHEDARTAGIVIGHDARHNSEKWARLTAAAFLYRGFQVHWFGRLVHTPLVPFTVKEKSAVGGVMITASHNPKDDNGYKVYTRTGCQINTPEDSQIAASILDNLTPWTWDTSKVDELEPIYHDMLDQYCHAVSAHLSFKRNECPRFVYTAMHGVGTPIFLAAFDACTREATTTVPSQCILTREQCSPDPEFSTVKFPNPEESGALDLAISTAEKQGITLVLANDPDADRFSIAEKVAGKWYQFKGDEVGVLLGYYLYTKHGADPSRGPIKMFNSVVSSQMLSQIGLRHGFEVAETLTGFKWIGPAAYNAEGAVFGYEEALGYMIPQILYDKDGVSAAMLLLEAMISWKCSPYAKMQELYETYGYFKTMNTYWMSPSKDATQGVVSGIWDTLERRFMDQTNESEMRLTRLRNLQIDRDTSTSDGRATLPSAPDNMMLTFWMESSAEQARKVSCRVTIRASGTEPKIKVYIEAQSGSEETAVQAAKEALLEVKTWMDGFQGLKLEQRMLDSL